MRRIRKVDLQWNLNPSQVAVSANAEITDQKNLTLDTRIRETEKQIANVIGHITAYDVLFGTLVTLVVAIITAIPMLFFRQDRALKELKGQMEAEIAELEGQIEEH